jgi:hypothetical protein
VTDQVVDNQALDLGALRELCEKATPGPWEARLDRYDPVIVSAGSNWPHGDDEAHATAYVPADAVFIAAARSAVPALLAEVERLRAERDRARDIAVALEQQTAEAVRIVEKRLSTPTMHGIFEYWEALNDLHRILGVPDDDEENQP